MTFQQISDVQGASSYSPLGEKLYTLKFVLTGSAGVGKTQLAARIVRGEFRGLSLPTVGMEFATRPLRYSQHSSVRAQVWCALCCLRLWYVVVVSDRACCPIYDEGLRAWEIAQYTYTGSYYSSISSTEYSSLQCFLV